ncbi:MAG: phosphate ABC transporter substrate-binding protein [Desulfovibrionaceae bacterium]
MFKATLAKSLLVLLSLCVLVGSYTVPVQAESLVYQGSSTLLESFLENAGKAFEADTGIKFQAAGSSTGKGLLAIMSGQCAIAGGGRTLKPEEKNKGIVETPIALNIIAFMVNDKNPVSNLTLAQLKGILAGEITNWKEVGGDDAPVLLVFQPEKSSTKSTVEKKVLGDKPMTTKGFPVKSSPETVDKVIQFAPGITFNSYCLAKQHKGIKVVAVDGVQPLPENAKAGKYGLTMTMYLYTKGAPAGVAKQFMDFLNSDKGQAIITSSGMSGV